MQSRGHKAAFASLALLPLLPPEQAEEGGRRGKLPCNAAAPAAAAASSAAGVAAASTAWALLWEGRVLTLGASNGCALVVPPGGLTSRCHAAVQLHGGAVWLTDTSRHGTLLLELPEGSAVAAADGITAAQLDALPWAGATALGGTSAQLVAGTGHRALILTGVRSTDWLAAAKEGQMSREIRKGAALLLYEQFAPLPSGQPVDEGAAAVSLPQEPPAALLPFARTPSRPQRPPHGERHAKEPPPKRDLPRPAQAFNIFQLAAVAMRRAHPVVTAAERPAAAKGPAKKKVRWSDEQQEQQQLRGAKEVAGSSKEGRTICSGNKAPGGKAAGEGGELPAAAPTGRSKENVTLPAKAPATSTAGAEAAPSRVTAAGTKWGRRGTSGSGAAPSESDGISVAACKNSGGNKAKPGKGHGKALLQRMQKSRSSSG